MRRTDAWTVLVSGAAYAIIGIGTAVLASVTGGKTWRIAAWLFSLAVFALHFAFERRKRAERLGLATRLALGVALGALVVAALGPVRAHWAEASRTKLVLLSLIAWPILTGVPAFLVAWVGGFLFDRMGAATPRQRSPTA